MTLTYNLTERVVSDNYTHITLRLGKRSIATIAYRHDDKEDYNKRLYMITGLKELLELEQVQTLQDWRDKITDAVIPSTTGVFGMAVKYPQIGMKFLSSFNELEPNLPHTLDSLNRLIELGSI